MTTGDGENRSCEVKNGGMNGFVLFRTNCDEDFTRRFVHMAEGGGFLCISKRQYSCEEKLLCTKDIIRPETPTFTDTTESETETISSLSSEDSSSECVGILSLLWSLPFLQIQITSEDHSISEFSGTIPEVPAEYSFGLQGGWRPVTTAAAGRGPDEQSHVKKQNGNLWSLLFSSEEERDQWKMVLVRAMAGSTVLNETQGSQRGRLLLPLNSCESTDVMALRELALEMFTTISIDDRFAHAIKYSDCFTGAEAISFIMHNMGCGESHALRIGLQLTSLGWIHHVTHQHYLRNEHLFYQFDYGCGIFPPSLEAKSRCENVPECASVDEDADMKRCKVVVLDSRSDIRDLAETNEELKADVVELSRQAAGEVSSLRLKIKRITQCLSVLLAAYLCHSVASVLSHSLYGAPLTITWSYIVDTLLYVINLSLLEHFCQVPSCYILHFIDPDHGHANFDGVIDKESGELRLSGDYSEGIYKGRDEWSLSRPRSESVSSSSSDTSLEVATSDMGEDECGEAVSSLPRPARSWSVDSIQSTGGKGKSGSEGSDGGRGRDVPHRYIRDCRGDLVEARRRWGNTLAWRRETGLTHLLKEPQEHFNDIVESCPHFLHGRSARDADGSGAGGHPVLYLKLHGAFFAALRARGVSKDSLIGHALFLLEYVFTHLSPGEDGQMVTVVDVKGMGLSDLTNGLFSELWRELFSVLQTHFVGRSHKIFIINASSTFRVMWRMMKPLLAGETRRKIKILREGSDLVGPESRLGRCLGLGQIPDDYGGSGGVLGSSEDERLLRNFVSRLNSADDQ